MQINLRPTTLCTLALLALTLLIFSGCTRQVMTVEPGRVEVEELQAPDAGAKWSLWIEQITDARPEGKAGSQQIGTLDQRFSDEPIRLSLNENPDAYLKEQLSGFLLTHGWEASDARHARVLVGLELYRFEVTRDATEVWDEMTMYVDYRVSFSNKTGKLLGTVKIPSHQQIKTALVTEKAIEEVVREVLASTFKALVESKAFQDALAHR
jgi:hypothetical protein